MDAIEAMRVGLDAGCPGTGLCARLRQIERERIAYWGGFALDITVVAWTVRRRRERGAA